MKKLILIVILNLLVCHTSAFAKARYVSLAPSTTEILFALGLDDEIVAVSSFCDYPPKALSKEKAGDFSHPNIEKIIALKPDYIFLTGLEQAPAIAELKRLGLNVYVSDPVNIKELFESISDIGKITGKEKQAGELITDMKLRINAITAKTELIPEDKKIKVFVEVWHDPLMTVGKDSFISEIITIAGGKNIALDTKKAYSPFSPEEVISRNPCCIILTYMQKDKPLELMRRRLGWGQISAIKNNRIYNDINPDILLRPGPRIAEAIEEVYKRLYP